MEKPTLKHYVEFLYPGALFSETSVEEVAERDPRKVQAPRECFGYKFFDRLEVRVGDETLIGESKNHSGTFYFGRVMTLEDVKREMPEADILIRNMKGNGYDRIVKTRRGNFQPFTKKDKIVSDK